MPVPHHWMLLLMPDADPGAGGQVRLHTRIARLQGGPDAPWHDSRYHGADGEVSMNTDRTRLAMPLDPMTTRELAALRDHLHASTEDVVRMAIAELAQRYGLAAPADTLLTDLPDPAQAQNVYDE